MLLIAAPLLIVGASRDDDDEKKKTTEAAWDSTAPRSDGSDDLGSYQAKPSSPTAEKDTKEKSEKPEEGKNSTGNHTEETKKNTAESKSAGQPDTTVGSTSEDEAPKKESGANKVAKPLTAVSAPFQNKQIRNVMTGQCADITGFGKGKPGDELMQFPCANDRSADNQVWSLVVKAEGKGPGGRNLFAIKNVKDGLCLDLPGQGAVPGATGITENKCASNLDDNQQWWLQARDNGKYWIRNSKSNDMCLDVWGKTFGAGGDAARLGVANCYPKDDHEWRLT
ncbi:RICIN domain-containing protein [Streptomyces sp. NPDC088788]|uniref:RICIN domain-containing protein n=1 Tax=Streptomyces sp. NPDC088788 TaxID=3365898 RepID=UPI0038206ECD